MHAAFFMYSLYSVAGKFAAREDFLSKKFILLYALIFCILFVYALIWQQVLKTVPLTIASANKAATIAWGMVFGKLIFDERISPAMIAGALLIVAGIALLATEKTEGA